MSVLDGPRVAPAKPPAQFLVILCHGYGSDGHDLIALAPYLQTCLPGAAFVSPHAPEPSGAGVGYQWFPVPDFEVPTFLRGLTHAVPALNAFADAELAKLSLGPDRLILVGFSQGAMVALNAGLRRASAPAAIVAFSGALVDPNALPAAHASPLVLLIHGADDDVVPAHATVGAGNALKEAGVPVSVHILPGLTHGIDQRALNLACAFLRDAAIA